jgi:hypothetical protein
MMLTRALSSVDRRQRTKGFRRADDGGDTVLVAENVAIEEGGVPYADLAVALSTVKFKERVVSRAFFDKGEETGGNAKRSELFASGLYQP